MTYEKLVKVSLEGQVLQEPRGNMKLQQLLICFVFLDRGN